MATVIGESGVWQAIAADLAGRGHAIAAPRDLAPLLGDLERHRPSLVEDHHVETSQFVADLARQIAALENESGFFQRIVNWFRRRALNARIDDLHAKDLAYATDLDQTIARVRTVLVSPEFAGAQAECSIIERLRTLPSSMTVFNDVRLEATRYIHFNGAALMSAQIDHVVLSPAGVFVVETKRWSRRFVESGDFHDPFEQISRANYLCFDLLRQRFGKTRVRSIIASGGNLPPAPSDSYIKVLRPDDLARYIASFRNVELTPERLRDIYEFFERRVGPGYSLDSLPQRRPTRMARYRRPTMLRDSSRWRW